MEENKGTLTWKTVEDRLCQHCNRLKLHSEPVRMNLIEIKKGVWHMEPACRIHWDWAYLSPKP